MQNSPTRSAAFDEAIELFQLPNGSQLEYGNSGFIDVLGESDPISPHLIHQLVHSKILARIYERVWRPITGRIMCGRGMAGGEELRATLEMLSIETGDRVLDVGCGPGNYTRHLARHAGDGLVVGLDASKAMLDVAMKQGGSDNLAYVRGNACVLPFESGAFDAVCCIGVIHMIDDSMSVLDEMVRVLAPGGCLVVGASCGDVDERAELPGGVRVFGRDELTGALEARSLVDVGQRVSHRGQFVWGQRPMGSHGS